MAIDAFTEDYEEIELFGKPALYTISRITRDTVPPAFNVYDIRHSDDGDPDTIEDFVFANHMATVITIDPVEFDPSSFYRPYKNIESGDINFIGKRSQLKEFAKAYITDIEEKNKQEPPTEQEFIEQWRCKCDAFKGHQFEGEVCPFCVANVEKRE